MGITTISWTATAQPDGSVTPGFTYNPWIGCHRVSPACAHCYADTLATNRMGLDVWDRKTPRPRKMMSEAYWHNPLKWEKAAAATGQRAKVFCASMADVFEDHPDVLEARHRLWHIVDATPHLDWLVLTKRPENVLGMVPFRWCNKGKWPDNVWLGTSVENQHFADIRIPQLLQIPAKVRFLSCEPLLGPLDLSPWLPTRALHWVIVGGESGTGFRPMHLDHARALRDQCAVAGVPYFFKQIGGIRSTSGGDLLDEQRYHAWPQTRITADSAH